MLKITSCLDKASGSLATLNFVTVFTPDLQVDGGAND